MLINPSTTIPKPGLIPRFLVGFSSGLLAVERVAITLLMFMLAGLVLFNVVTRYAGRPIYWVDEACVYAIVWLTFIGASTMTRMRLDFAVGMLTERFSLHGQALARRMATLTVVVFALLLGWMCWLWLDPVGIASAGFDARKFAGTSFNFIYTERTQTLGWPNWVFYLIMPLFAACLLIHSLANLMEDFGVHPIVALPPIMSAKPLADHGGQIGQPGQIGAVT
jgi:TRAP-type C4-dicarboxylate transport system permease small subunit